ncbi:MAG TPA: alpha/beta hydrolase, partial [Ilumatobacteraceae bacterium]|nr:alpha/beta hydrolase [Ilumatobacteraceae bacterium]
MRAMDAPTNPLPPTTGAAATDLHVETWGAGAPVLLVHGSLATGAEEWDAQRPLAAAGFRLLVLDRRGYGRSPAAAGEDFLVDAADIAALMGDGAHLVGHSYGGLGVMFAAAQRPEATLSLALLEAPATTLAQDDPDWRALVEGVTRLWDEDLPDDEWVVRFLTAVGSDPDQLGPDLLAAAVSLVPVFRQGRPFYDREPPLDELATARFPKLVVSGGHHPGFDAMCAELAGRIGAAHEVIAGAGHEIQFTGDPVNEA